MLALPTIDAVESDVLDRVGRIARGLLADVELFHPLHEPESAGARAGATTPDTHIRTRIAERQRRLERLADTLREQRVNARTTVSWDFPAHEAIVRQVLRHEPQLVIVPSTRTGRARGGILTQSDYRLIETCPCPLLLLKTPRVYARGSVLAAVDPLHSHGKPPELDEAIMGAANTIAAALGDTDVHVYHAVVPPTDSAGPNSSPLKAGTPADLRLRAAQLKKVTAHVRTIASRHDVPRARVHVEFAEPAGALPHRAREVRAEIVVMGAVSRTATDRVLFGHTAEKVLDALQCDVLVIKPNDFRAPVSPMPVSQK